MTPFHGAAPELGLDNHAQDVLTNVVMGENRHLPVSSRSGVSRWSRAVRGTK
jgi:hypothetical protein